MKKKTIIISIIIFVILSIIIGVIITINVMQKSLDSLSNITITNVDLTKVSDGTHKGSYKAFPVTAEVEVIVENHKIIKINLTKHINGQGSAAEVIPSNVVKAGSLDVDIVSGATYSSKVILKAIENALIK